MAVHTASKTAQSTPAGTCASAPLQTSMPTRSRHVGSAF